VECTLGKEAGLRYINHFRNSQYIKNRQPIIGPLHVNWTDWSSSDHYFKGAWVLHTLRSDIANDKIWFDLLKTLYTTFHHKIITSEDIFDFVSKHLGKDYSKFFEQYFYYESIPTLEYEIFEKKGKIRMRYITDVKDFEMGMVVRKENDPEVYRFDVCNKWKSFPLEGISVDNFEIGTDLYLVKTKSLNQ